jgi:hypothetical protein
VFRHNIARPPCVLEMDQSCPSSVSLHSQGRRRSNMASSLQNRVARIWRWRTILMPRAIVRCAIRRVDFIKYVCRLWRDCQLSMVTSIYCAIENWCAGRNMKSACIAVECSVVTCCRRLVSWPALIQVSTVRLRSLQVLFIGCYSNASIIALHCCEI